MGVIEIQCMAGDSVDQCRVGDAQPVGRAEHPGLRITAKRQALLPGDPCGGFLGARDGEAEMIEQAPGALVQHLGGDVGRRRCDATKSSNVRVSTEVRSS